RVEKDELVQSAVVPDVSIYFGDRKWTDYDFTIDAKLTENTDGFAMWFRGADEQNAYIYAVGPFGNTKHVVHSIEKGNWSEHAVKDIKNDLLKTGHCNTATVSIRATP